MTLIDTHAHLNFKNYKNNLSEVVKRAEKEGVSRIIVVGTNIENSKRAVEIAESFPNISASVGVHPTEERNVNDWKELEKLAKHEKTVAVGEIGFDFYRIKKGKGFEKQADRFRSQAKIALENNLPVIIHSRNAKKETLRELEKFSKKGLTGVQHCFAEDIPFAESMIELGFLISFTGIVTYENSDKLREVVKTVSSEKYMLETDCPFLTPEPSRNERNEPKNVKIIAQKISTLRKTDLETVSKETTTNAKKLFNLT